MMSKLISVLIAMATVTAVAAMQEGQSDEDIARRSFEAEDCILDGCVPSFCLCKKYEVHCDSDDGKTSMDAQKFCEGRGGTLANLKTKEIDDAVREFIYEQGLANTECAKNYGFWFGLGDKNEEGKYVWSDGTPLCDSYTNWAPGEPNNNDKQDDDGQDCSQLWFKSGKNLRWDDEYCSYRPKGIICEIPKRCCCSS